MKLDDSVLRLIDDVVSVYAAAGRPVLPDGSREAVEEVLLRTVIELGELDGESFLAVYTAALRDALRRHGVEAPVYGDLDEDGFREQGFGGMTADSLAATALSEELLDYLQTALSRWSEDLSAGDWYNDAESAYLTADWERLSAVDRYFFKR